MDRMYVAVVVVVQSAINSVTRVPEENIEDIPAMEGMDCIADMPVEGVEGISIFIPLMVGTENVDRPF